MDDVKPGFVSYEKMGDRPESWGLDEAGERALSRVSWVVTEKIHGANFVLLCDGETVRSAKRKQLLDEEEDFFGHRAVVARLTEPVRELWAAVAAGTPGLLQIAVHGELFGGGYPHPDVPPVEGVQPVQTGVWYAPGVEFCAFDLAVWAPGRRYLDFDRAMGLIAGAGLMASEALFVGRRDEAMSYPIEFTTTLPGRLGLPPLPEPNLAEGVVIKPTRELDLRDAAGHPVRPILKRKIAIFAEDARFHGAERWARVPASQLDALRQHISWLINEPRLAAARSKIGPVRPGDRAVRAELAARVIEDIETQLDEDWGEIWRTLGPGDRQAALAHLASEVEALIQLYVDG
jgi:Rnl2 family RNA ligase